MHKGIFYPTVNLRSLELEFLCRLQAGSVADCVVVFKLSDILLGCFDVTDSVFVQQTNIIFGGGLTGKSVKSELLSSDRAVVWITITHYEIDKHSLKARVPAPAGTPS